MIWLQIEVEFNQSEENQCNIWHYKSWNSSMWISQFNLEWEIKFKTNERSNSKQLWDKIQNKAQNQVKMHLWMTFDVVLFLLRFNFVILTSLSPRTSSLSLSSVTHSSWKLLMWPWRDEEWRNNFSLLLNPVPTSSSSTSSVEADVQAAKHPAEPLSPCLHKHLLYHCE